MANTIISFLQEKGYNNTGDNRNFAIKSINTVLDSGFVKIVLLDYERSKTHGWFWEKDGKHYRTIYKVTVFGKTYLGHWMPTHRKTNFGGGMISRDELDYKNLDLYAILCRIAQLISLNKNGFDFLKNGNCNCSKCNGTGFIPQFAHYANGVCFDCGGTGIKSGILKEYIKNNVKQAGE